jgi:hypothetical protein
MDCSPPSSPLLKLLAELRNKLYTYVLGREIFEIYCWRQYTPFSFATRIVQKQKNFLALLAVCHQLYAETRLLPFILNAFHFKSQDASQPWLKKSSIDQEQAIREVHIVTRMARHMVEGEGWFSKPLSTVFPVDML